MSGRHFVGLAFVAVLLGGCARAKTPNAIDRPTFAIDVIEGSTDDGEDASVALFAPPPEVAPQPTQATPPNIEEARRRYGHVMSCWNDGDYECALVELARAYQLQPNYRILYNIGLMLERLGRYGEAHAVLRRYVDAGGDQIPSERRREVEIELGRIEAQTGWLAIACDGDVERILLDERDLTSVRRCPIRMRVRVTRGEHRLVASSRAGAVATRSISAGESTAAAWIHRRVGAK